MAEVRVRIEVFCFFRFDFRLEGCVVFLVCEYGTEGRIPEAGLTFLVEEKNLANRQSQTATGPKG